nr:NADH dehydrogenase subunit 4 [Tripetaloceroides tonkinensis]
MLVLLMMMGFMIPLCVFNMWWLFQFWFIFLVVLFLLLGGSFHSCWNNLGFGLGLDNLSWLMILLSFWICFLMLLASVKVKLFFLYSDLFMLMLLVLAVFLCLSFSVLNYFSFYFFFEASLIPTLMIILGWGYQPERVQAGVYMLIYTLLASLPLLGVLLYVNVNLGGLFMGLVSDVGGGYWIYFGLMTAFMVSMPIFLFHFWLPSAHVEAPVSGSMILAGVLLKLGGYGVIRVMKLIYFFSLGINFFYLLLSLLGGVVVALSCLRQVDISMLIAYSSVSHMSLVISGLLTMNLWGVSGSIYVMVGHGLCSSGLFCLAGIVYERLGTRNVLLSRGLLSLMPIMCMWWFLLISSNMSAPFSLGFFGEIMLLVSIVSYSLYLLVLLFMLLFFSAAYGLYLYSSTQHGGCYSGFYSYFSSVFIEFHLMLLHWIPLNLFFFCGSSFSF